MVRSYSKELLLEEGFPNEATERILDVLPIASHNQRGRGTLLIGSEQRVRAENLVHILEASMSSETYELLKRPDEFFVVNKAHRNPRFVEDVVREMLRNVVEVYPDLPDEAFVLSKQENLESIHQHNAFAERYGTLGELRREITGGEYVVRHTTLEEWLEG
jgi:GTP cyclohydrolase-4